VLIVDDEPLGRRSVRRQLATVLAGAVVEEVPDACAALLAIAARPFALIFLDVEMPELSGLDLLRQLPQPRPKVIFVTAFSHFAVQAFEENACDYLVKPFTPERFAQAIARAFAELDSEARLDALERSLEHAGQRLERLALRRGDVVDIVAVRDIVGLVSEAHYTYVHSAGREYLSDLSLQHFWARLDPSVFLRVHRRAIVNITRVVRLRDSGEIELEGGLRVQVSRRNKPALLAALRGAGR
jgi:two-component system LytT family response regulator